MTNWVVKKGIIYRGLDCYALCVFMGSRYSFFFSLDTLVIGNLSRLKPSFVYSPNIVNLERPDGATTPKIHMQNVGSEYLAMITPICTTIVTV